MASPSLFDTHCHLDYIQRETLSIAPPSPLPPPEGEGKYNDVFQDVMMRAADAGVAHILNPGVTPQHFPEILALAERYEHVYAALAVHPTDVQDIPSMPDCLEELASYLNHPKVKAIGETGLDYYRDTSHAALQKECFQALLRLAVKHELPVIIHDREAHDDIYELISETKDARRGIMHCFSGDPAFARKMINLGFYISFAGNLTFKNATNLHEAVKVVPLEWLLIETDAPFLSPVPFRGVPNEPARVRHVAEKVAELRGISYEEVAYATTENAKRAFGLC